MLVLLRGGLRPAPQSFSSLSLGAAIAMFCSGETVRASSLGDADDLGEADDGREAGVSRRMPKVPRHAPRAGKLLPAMSASSEGGQQVSDFAQELLRQPRLGPYLANSARCVPACFPPLCWSIFRPSCFANVGPFCLDLVIFRPEIYPQMAKHGPKHGSEALNGAAFGQLWSLSRPVGVTFRDWRRATFENFRATFVTLPSSASSGPPASQYNEAGSRPRPCHWGWTAMHMFCAHGGASGIVCPMMHVVSPARSAVCRATASPAKTWSPGGSSTRRCPSPHERGALPAAREARATALGGALGVPLALSRLGSGGTAGGHVKRGALPTSVGEVGPK